MLHRRDFLKTAALLARRAASQPARPPNLLLLLAPASNLDELAHEGVSFERAYASDPADSPARAALITGRFPHACGVPRDDIALPLDQPSIAQQLKSAGYRTGFIGEWRLDGAATPGFVPPGERRHGFDTWAAYNKRGAASELIYFRDKSEVLHGTGAAADYETGLAIDFLKQSRRNPFFLFLAWGSEPAGNVRRLLGALNEHRLTGDTIVAITSAYGAKLGAGTPFEGSVHVPLIIRYPGKLAAGSRNDALISSVDLMPTLLGLCGVDLPPGVQGQDLSNWIVNQHGERPESVYCTGKLGSAAEWRRVVRALDKLVVDRDLNVTHLYNLGQDPDEMQNLVHDASQDLKRDELEALLKEWMRRTGDRMDPSGLKKRG